MTLLRLFGVVSQPVELLAIDPTVVLERRQLVAGGGMGFVELMACLRQPGLKVLQGLARPAPLPAMPKAPAPINSVVARGVVQFRHRHGCLENRAPAEPCAPGNPGRA